MFGYRPSSSAVLTCFDMPQLGSDPDSTSFEYTQAFAEFEEYLFVFVRNVIVGDKEILMPLLAWWLQTWNTFKGITVDLSTYVNDLSVEQQAIVMEELSKYIEFKLQERKAKLMGMPLPVRKDEPVHIRDLLQTRLLQEVSQAFRACESCSST